MSEADCASHSYSKRGRRKLEGRMRAQRNCETNEELRTLVQALETTESRSSKSQTAWSEARKTKGGVRMIEKTFRV